MASRSFSGVSTSHLETTSPPVTAYPITMACWARPTDLTTDHPAMSLNNNGTSSRLEIRLAGTQAGDPVRFVANGTAVNSATAYVANAWNHVCFVAASATNRVGYLNYLQTGSSRVTSTSSQVLSSITRLHIGKQPSGGNMNGQVFWPAIWDVALTDGEVAALAAGADPRTIRPQNLVFFMPDIGNGDPIVEAINGLVLSVNSATKSEETPRVFFMRKVRTSRGTQAAAGGAMSGSSAVTTSVSGTLSGTGALSGSAAVTTSPAGQLTGSGSLAGSSSVSASASGTLSGAGALSGSSQVSISASGTLTGVAACEGSASVVCTASLTVGQDGMTGSTAVTTAASGTLTGSGALAGSASVALSATGTLTGAGQLSGSSDVSIAPSGQLSGSASLSGSVSVTTAASATLGGSGELSGTCEAIISAAASLSGSGALAGSASVALSASMISGELKRINKMETASSRPFEIRNGSSALVLRA